LEIRKNHKSNPYSTIWKAEGPKIRRNMKKIKPKTNNPLNTCKRFAILNKVSDKDFSDF